MKTELKTFAVRCDVCGETTHAIAVHAFEAYAAGWQCLKGQQSTFRGVETTRTCDLCPVCAAKGLRPDGWVEAESAMSPPADRPEGEQG